MKYEKNSLSESSLISIGRIVLWVLAFINVVLYVIAGAMSLFYIDGLGGLFGAFISIPFVLGIIFLSIVGIFISKKLAKKQAKILVITVLIINLFASVFAVSLIMEGNNERLKEVSYNIASGNPTYEDCLSLSHPRHMSLCAKTFSENNNDYLSCLKLSKESYTRFPEQYEYPGFKCTFGKGTYIGKLIYTSTLLDDPDRLEFVLDIFDKKETDYYEDESTRIYKNADTYDDCYKIINTTTARLCAQKVLTATKDFEGCIELSYKHGQKTAEFKETDLDYFECSLGELSYSGNDYNQGLDLDKEKEAEILMISKGLHLTENGAKKDLAYKYCENKLIKQIDINSEVVTPEIKDAMEILNTDILYQSCETITDYSVAVQLDEIYKDLKEYDLYNNEIIATSAAYDLHCAMDSHLVDISDIDLDTEIKSNVIELGIESVYRPCLGEAEYNEVKELSGLDWELRSENRVEITSLDKSIVIDNFKINPVIASTWMSLPSDEYNQDGYDYEVSVAFDNPGDIKTGRSTDLNMFDEPVHPISMRKEIENSNTIRYCKVDETPGSWYVDVTKFEKKLGGLLSIEFEAQADCDGEKFKLNGKYSIRIPIAYKENYITE